MSASAAVLRLVDRRDGAGYLSARLIGRFVAAVAIFFQAPHHNPIEIAGYELAKSVEIELAMGGRCFARHRPTC